MEKTADDGLTIKKAERGRRKRSLEESCASLLCVCVSLTDVGEVNACRPRSDGSDGSDSSDSGHGEEEASATRKHPDDRLILGCLPWPLFREDRTFLVVSARVFFFLHILPYTHFMYEAKNAFLSVGLSVQLWAAEFPHGRGWTRHARLC